MIVPVDAWCRSCGYESRSPICGACEEEGSAGSPTPNEGSRRSTNKENNNG